ncbi:multivesicular body subunit 12Bb isoform 2-T3 [Spinachia spinachia]
MEEVSSQLPADPISAVGVVTSLNKAPDGYYAVAQTTDGFDADLWKDGLFKSKVKRYLCFARKTGADAVVDIKLLDAKDALPEGFTPVEETLDTKETATRKRRLCVKIIPRAAAVTAVYDIQIVAKSKYNLVNYTCIGEMNSVGIWYRMGDVSPPRASHNVSCETSRDAPGNTASLRTSTRPDYGPQSSGHYTMTVSLQLHHGEEHCCVTFHPDGNTTDGIIVMLELRRTSRYTVIVNCVINFFLQ